MEREEYAKAQSTGIRERKERGSATDMLEQILDGENLNRAYKQVKRNNGAPEIDEMTVEEAFWPGYRNIRTSAKHPGGLVKA